MSFDDAHRSRAILAVRAALKKSLEAYSPRVWSPAECAAILTDAARLTLSSNAPPHSPSEASTAALEMDEHPTSTIQSEGEGS